MDLELHVSFADRYSFFASHKKSHTRFGDASAGDISLGFVTQNWLDLCCCPDLARASKDYLKLAAGLEGYFDAGEFPHFHWARQS